ARDVGVADLAAVAVELVEGELLDAPAARVRPGVPTPVRLRRERNRRVEGIGKRLQPGCVSREGELAVADAERRLAIELPQQRIVPRDERLPIDRRRASLGRRLS